MEKKVLVDWDQSKEIAAYILKVDKDNAEDDYAVVEDALFKKWGIDLEIFGEICNEVFKLMTLEVSPLTEQFFVGLALRNIKKESNAKTNKITE